MLMSKWLNNTMEMLKKLLRELKEEASGAEKYYKCSLKYKDEYPAWSNKYATMAQQEISHFEEIAAMAEHYVSKHPDLKPILEFEIDWLMEDLAPLKAKLRM